MQLIPTPKKIEFIKESKTKGNFVIEPLYPGYGITVGNALRRVLFSSMPGAAIVSVKIKGVDHEFSSINYVKEGVVDILLNIKQINLQIEGEIDKDNPIILRLDKKGEGKITAADIKCPTQVTIANKEQIIATLTDKAANFEAEFMVDKGMGYLPTENRAGEKLDIGHIAVDAIFTPIELAAMETENVRVGEMTNWDKLILTIGTNGTISCEEAFALAVNILIDQFAALKTIKEPGEEVEESNSLVDEETGEEKEKEKKKVEESTEEKVEEKIDETPKKKRGRPKKES